MSADISVPKNANDSIALLMSASIGRDNASLEGMLKTLVAELDFFGCILWEMVSLPASQAFPSEKRLVAIGQWFPDGHLCHSKPPLSSSVGKTVLSQKPVSVEDVMAHSDMFIDPLFFECANIKSMFSLPINFHDKAKGALSFFRTQSIPLSLEERTHIESIVSIIPTLYDTIRNKVRLNLIRNTDIILRRAEVRKGSHVPLKHRVKRDLLHLCRGITKTLKCMETSIFLKPSVNSPGVCKLASSTWELVSNSSHSKEQGGALPFWLSGQACPVYIFDLRRPIDDRQKLREEYPDLKSDSLPGTHGNGYLQQSNGNGHLNPLSLMSVPIAIGGEVLGCIRCLTVKQDSHHFSKRDLELLHSIAIRIGLYWSYWLKQCETEEQVFSWKIVAQGLRTLDDFAVDALAREGKRAERLITNKALVVAASAISGAHILDVRHVNEAAQELNFFEVHGEAWLQGTAATVNARKQTSFPVVEAGAAAFRTGVLQKGKTCLVTSDSIESFYSGTFPETKQMIMAPISLHGSCYGLLDICGTGDPLFSEHAIAIAEIICQRLATYKQLAETSHQQREAEFKLTELIQIHSQFHEDLAHQLKSPLIQAHSRVKKALRHGSLDNNLKSNLQAVRGLCSKATKVTGSTKLFAALARGEAFKPNLSNLWHDDLIKILIEAATDNELMASPSHPIAFRTNREMLDFLPTNKVLAKIDYDLFQQAINNLLDNAGKYSYKNTVVRISASFDANGRFFISVVNEGLPIRHKDVAKCIQRHWRGEQASRTTGEGSGIGLWIVHHIMEAHQGQLVINPTTTNNLTEVRLVFS